MFVYIVGYMVLKGFKAIICDEGFSLPSENMPKAVLEDCWSGWQKALVVPSMRSWGCCTHKEQ